MADPLSAPGGSKAHKHQFSALWWHFGLHGGRQDCHVHSCFEDGCDRVLIGKGKTCSGNAADHHRETLSDTYRKATCMLALRRLDASRTPTGTSLRHMRRSMASRLHQVAINAWSVKCWMPSIGYGGRLSTWHWEALDG